MGIGEAPGQLASIHHPDPWPRSRCSGSRVRRTDPPTADRAGQGSKAMTGHTRSVSIRTTRGAHPPGGPGPRKLWAGAQSVGCFGTGRALRGTPAKGCSPISEAVAAAATGKARPSGTSKGHQEQPCSTATRAAPAQLASVHSQAGSQEGESVGQAGPATRSTGQGDKG